MKQYWLMFFVATIALLTSCEEDLLVKTNPNSVTTGSYYNKPEHAVAAVNATYSCLQKFGVFNRYYTYTNVARSDQGIFTEYQVGLPEVNGLEDFTVTGDIQAVKENWRDPYTGVYKANLALENIEGIEMDEDLKNRCMGEAYFLRAVFNFHLINYFGEEIPLYTKVPISGDDFYPTSAEKGVIYDQIIEDLKLAKDLLPLVDTYRGTDNMGRASKGAATSLLGKVYLYTKQYALASAEFKTVINQEVGTYALIDNYRQNSDEFNEHNEESIFEVGYMFGAGIDVWNIGGENELASESQMIQQGSSMFRGNGMLWWNMAASEKTYNEFEEGDPRLYATLWCPGGAIYYDTDKDLNIVEKTYEQYSGSFPQKYSWRKLGSDYANKAQEDAELNIRVIRYADVLLMYAEAQIELDKFTEAETYINMVRERANKPTPQYIGGGTIPTVSVLMQNEGWSNDKAGWTKALRHERFVELAGESHRFNDIVRWDIGSEVLISGYKYVLPIPQAELDANSNLKPNTSN